LERSRSRAELTIIRLLGNCDLTLIIQLTHSSAAGAIHLGRTRFTLLLLLLLCGFDPLIQAQDGLATTDQPSQLKIVVAAPNTSSDSVITISPDTSWTGTFARDPKHPVVPQDSSNLAAWIQKESALNGLQSVDLHPWHIVIEYDQFDGDGDNVHSGVLEEVWVGPKAYRRSYKSDNLNQTDYATEKGLFRLGDQRWPNRAELQVRSEMIDPFSYAATLQGFNKRNVERTFGAHSLDCVLLERSEPGTLSGPTQYCFEHTGSVLRYTRGFGWFQTTYNDVFSFQGRSLARQVDVTDGGKPYLKLRIKSIESVANIDEKDLAPPANAVSLQGKRLSGVSLRPVKQPFPEWPTSLQQQHFSVTVEIVVGKDGRVINAHAVAGPSNAYKAAENTVRKWTFQPYLVLDEPVEVESKVMLNNN
jgi:Gram-negative bacterial TonB protein C-terminal